MAELSPPQSYIVHSLPGGSFQHLFLLCLELQEPLPLVVDLPLPAPDVGLLAVARLHEPVGHLVDAVHPAPIGHQVGQEILKFSAGRLNML